MNGPQMRRPPGANGSTAVGIDQLGAAETTRQTAMEILTSHVAMQGLFQKVLANGTPDALRIKSCQPQVLKERLGSRQVVGYRLEVESDDQAGLRVVELVGKRYANRDEGGAAFEAMRMLADNGFAVRHRRKVPQPICYLPEFKLLVQSKADGIPLYTQVARGNSTSVALLRMAAHWLAKLHDCAAPVPESNRSTAEADSLKTFVGELARTYPDRAERFEELGTILGQRFAAFGDVPRTWVHGDYQPENIFVTKEGATVIDFDGFTVGDPARDLGYFVSHTRAQAYRSAGSLTAADTEVRAFLDAYFATMPAVRRQLSARTAAYAAHSCFEILYYICCVMKDHREELLAEFVGELTRFVLAKDMEDILQ